MAGQQALMLFFKIPVDIPADIFRLRAFQKVAFRLKWQHPADAGLIHLPGQEKHRNIRKYGFLAYHLQNLCTVADRHFIIQQDKVRALERNAADSRYRGIGHCYLVIFLQHTFDRIAERYRFFRTPAAE